MLVRGTLMDPGVTDRLSADHHDTSSLVLSTFRSSSVPPSESRASIVIPWSPSLPPSLPPGPPSLPQAEAPSFPPSIMPACLPVCLPGLCRPSPSVRPSKLGPNILLSVSVLLPVGAARLVKLCPSPACRSGVRPDGKLCLLVMPATCSVSDFFSQ
jgi:hypothetical protein